MRQGTEFWIVSRIGGALELKALLDLIQTAKLKQINIETLLEEHNRHCTGPNRD